MYMQSSLIIQYIYSKPTLHFSSQTLTWYSVQFTCSMPEHHVGVEKRGLTDMQQFFQIHERLRLWLGNVGQPAAECTTRHKTL